MARENGNTTRRRPEGTRAADEADTSCPLCDYVAPTDFHLLKHMADAHPWWEKDEERFIREATARTLGRPVA